MRPAYFDRYPTIAFERTDDGILTMRFHSDGGPVAYRAQHHSDWCGAFHDAGIDRANKVVILTGTGDEFIHRFAWDKGVGGAEEWEDIHSEGKRLLRNLLDMEMPVIGAVNGPATIHAELAALSDITLAATTAIFQDAAHMLQGTVPGDGVHVVWPELLGSNRGRYFLMTGQILTAQEAKDLGVVNEILPPDQLMPRAMAIAKNLLKANPLTLRYTRTALTQRWKRLLDESLGYGLALEGLAILDLIQKMKQ